MLSGVLGTIYYGGTDWYHCRGHQGYRPCAVLVTQRSFPASRTASVRVCEKTCRPANHQLAPRKLRARRRYTDSQRAGDTFSYPQKRSRLWTGRFFHRPVSDRDGTDDLSRAPPCAATLTRPHSYV